MRLASRLIAALALAAALVAPGAAAPSFSSKEAGVRVSSAVIQAATGAFPALRLYYIRGSTAVYSATTTDGITLTEDPDVRLSTSTQPALDIAISSITGLAIQPLNAGGFRMLYSVIGSTGAYRIYTATSADGLAWANSTGTAVDAGTNVVGSPAVVTLASGDWRLFAVQGTTTVFTALSTNEGRNFGSTSTILSAAVGQIAAAKLTNNNVRLYYTAPPAVGVTTNTQVLSALSSNALATAFALETGVRLSTGSGLGSISNPFVVRSTEAWRWRMYYDFKPFSVFASTSDVYSATADAPDVQTITPNIVLRTTPAPGFTITGEIFDPAPTASLSQGGQPNIAGAGVARIDDQTINVTFDTQNKNLGLWDLTVTNPTAQYGVLISALLVDFAGGDVRLTDNLLRPRDGTRTRFDVTTNNDGNVSIKVFTLDGRLVTTLFDGFASAGTTTAFWDGRASDGRFAASGVYVVRVKGPKVDAYNKVVLIK